MTQQKNFKNYVNDLLKEVSESTATKEEALNYYTNAKSLQSLTRDKEVALVKHCNAIAQDNKRCNVKGFVFELVVKMYFNAKRGYISSPKGKNDLTIKKDGKRIKVEIKSNGGQVTADNKKAPLTIYTVGETIEEMLQNARIYETTSFYSVLISMKQYRFKKKMSIKTKMGDDILCESIQSIDWKKRNNHRYNCFMNLVEMGATI